MKPARFSLAVALLAWTAGAAAHNTWLLADDYFASTGETVTLGMTSGMAFPEPDYAIKPGRVAVAQYRLSGETRGIQPTKRGEHALSFQISPDTAGVARIHVSLNPHPIELTPEEVKLYLTEAGAPERVWEAWRATPKPREWHESYTKHAVAFVRVGDPGETDSWRKPIGLPLEFVPQRDPTALEVGDSLTLRVLRNGEPYPGFAVSVVSANGKPSKLEADSKGRVQVEISQPGRYLIHGTDIRQSNSNEFGWESDFTTLTFAVKG